MLGCDNPGSIIGRGGSGDVEQTQRILPGGITFRGYLVQSIVLKVDTWRSSAECYISWGPIASQAPSFQNPGTCR